MGVSVLFLSSLYSHRTPRWFWLQLISAWPLWRPLLCSSLCGKTCNMARSASRVLACVLLALACSAMLCFVGTTPSPAAGSTPLKQSLRAPAVQMEARGGGEGALGDMSPDTYIIGITVFGIASLFANISGFFNPWEDMRRPESGSGHDIEVFSLLTSEGSICCPWQSRLPCDLGRHSVFEGTNVDRRWACFPCWHFLLAVGPGFSACLFGLQMLQPKESHFGEEEIWSHVSIAGCEHRRMWDTWVTLADNSQFKSIQNIHGCQCVVPIEFVFTSDSAMILASAYFSLTSLKAAPVQLSVWQNLQHGSLRLTCARLRALGPCLLGDALLCGHHSQSCCRKHPVEAVFAGTGRADGGARRRWGCPWRHESRHLHHRHHRVWDCILVCQHQRLLQPMRRHEKTREWQRPWYRGF